MRHSELYLTVKCIDRKHAVGATVEGQLVLLQLAIQFKDPVQILTDGFMNAENSTLPLVIAALGYGQLAKPSNTLENSRALRYFNGHRFIFELEAAHRWAICTNTRLALLSIQSFNLRDANFTPANIILQVVTSTSQLNPVYLQKVNWSKYWQCSKLNTQNRAHILSFTASLSVEDAEVDTPFSGLISNFIWNVHLRLYLSY